MLISAISALYLIAFGLGVFWRSPNQQDIFLFSFSSMIKSFYLGWFLFLASYFTSLGQVLPILAIVAAGASIVILIGRIESLGVVASVTSVRGAGRSALLLVLAAALGLTLIQALKPIGDVFMAWDALASWNRWAIELYSNTYRPMNAAYPILMPALWSLIYEAQSTPSMWYFSHALMSVIPLGVVALVAWIGLRQGVIAFLALFLPLYFGFIGKDALYSGYMDQPSALLAVGGLLLAVFALSNIEQSRRHEFLMLSVVSVALAVLTKQHGIFAAFAVCSLVAFMAFRREISFMRAASLAALFLVPVASFLFIYFQQQHALWGNLDLLHGVSDKAAAGQSQLVMGAKKLGAELPLWLWFLLGVGTLINLAFFRKAQALFALFIAALTIPGFLMYADCCTYSERNGIWILGHLAVSSYVGYSLLAERMAARKILPSWLASNPDQPREEGRAISASMAKTALALTAVAVLMFSSEWPVSRLMSRHVDQQRQILPRVQTMLHRHPALFKSTDSVISSVALARYHPDLMMLFRPCQPMNVKCFDKATPGKTLFMTASWFENPQTLAAIDRYVVEGRLKVVEQERGLIIYRLEKPLTDTAK